MNEPAKFIGKSYQRPDAWAKVNGSAQYVSDTDIPNLTYAAVVRSTHLHALIESINCDAARQMPGVIAVITHTDIPGAKIYADLLPDRPVLASDKVRFIGEPIALVVAKTRHAAESACRAVQIQYRPLPPVLDPVLGAQPDAPRVHEQGNVIGHFTITTGDLTAGFQQAEVELEETFYAPRIYPAYLETEASQAVVNPDGSLTVWVSSQKPFHDQHAIAEVLSLAVEAVQVKVAAIGGAFGGKEDSNLPILVSLAAYLTHGAVRMVNSREESMLAHPKRHPCVLHYRLGATREGIITSLDVTTHMDTGAYASYGPAVGQLLTEVTAGPYRIPNVRTETFVVYTNNPIAGAMRGFGAPQANFAIESMVDMLAHRLGMDPVEVRRRNIWQPGDANITRVRVNQAESTGISLEKSAAEIARLREIPPAAGKQAGVGMALALQTMGLGWGVPDDSTNRLEWQTDGRVLLRIGAPDLGQGLNLVAAQITSEALGIDPSQVEVAPIDTLVSPDGGVTCASRMTYMVGNSAMLAAIQLVENLKREGARLLSISPDQLDYQAGKLIRRDRPDLPAIPAAEITSRLAELNQTLTGSGTFSFPYGPEIPTDLGVGMPHVLFCQGAQIVRVEVDPQLGSVDVTHAVAIHDVGRVINRTALEGQVEGGLVMGLGFALCEEMVLKNNGRWVDNLAEYILPTSMDIPQEVKIVLLENPEESGPFGAKGIGEAVTAPTAAAVANAVANAVGARILQAPLRPERVLAAMIESSN